MDQETTCRETWTLADGTRLELRHIAPADSEIEQTFIRGLSDRTRYHRFHGTIKELSAAQLKKLTNPDPRYETALIVVHRADKGEEEIAVARYMIDKDRTSCEFAIVVADAWQNRGVGTRLMHALISHAQAQGIRRLYDPILASNAEMRKFGKHLGFSETRSADDPTVVVMAKSI
jgi:acetyltransferase